MARFSVGASEPNPGVKNAGSLKSVTAAGGAVFGAGPPESNARIRSSVSIRLSVLSLNTQACSSSESASPFFSFCESTSARRMISSRPAFRCFNALRAASSAASGSPPLARNPATSFMWRNFSAGGAAATKASNSAPDSRPRPRARRKAASSNTGSALAGSRAKRPRNSCSVTASSDFCWAKASTCFSTSAFAF